MVIGSTVFSLYCQEWMSCLVRMAFLFMASFFEVWWNLKQALCLQSSSFQDSVSRRVLDVPILFLPFIFAAGIPGSVHSWRKFVFIFHKSCLSLIICASSPFSLKLQCRHSFQWAVSSASILSWLLRWSLNWNLGNHWCFLQPVKKSAFTSEREYFISALTWSFCMCVYVLPCAFAERNRIFFHGLFWYIQLLIEPHVLKVVWSLYLLIL